jgi:membrane associated rhomboid family serine protease
MINNFLVSWDYLSKGKFWTLILSVFSHNMFFHIFLNMYVFFGFGSIVENVLGSKRFLSFYLMAGFISSIGHIATSAFLLKQPELPALGASGAVAATILLFALIYPQEKIFLLGIIPLPAISAALFFVGIDIWGLVAQTRGSMIPIGHGAHLGGSFFGLLYYFFYVRKSSELRYNN